MDNIENLSFEKAYDQLEDVIAQLESGELSLQDSVSLYEKGRLLSKHCQSLLDSAVMPMNGPALSTRTVRALRA